VPVITLQGASGTANSRARQIGDVQLRVVEYAPGYLADHWCSKGHVMYVITGELTIEHQTDQPPYELASGMGWHVGDNQVPAHRVRSDRGATVFILD
jgi:quercetin dioxygenase-like cupin family protein